MLSSAERLVQKIGRINALLFFVVSAGILLLSSNRMFGSVSMIIVILLPVSALVRWRGAASARLILSGKANLKKVALEGFAWGVGIPLLVLSYWFIPGGVRSPLWPLFASIAGFLTFLLIGCIGALTGVVFLFVNRRIVRANLPLNPDAPTTGAPVS